MGKNGVFCGVQASKCLCLKADGSGGLSLISLKRTGTPFCKEYSSWTADWSVFPQLISDWLVVLSPQLAAQAINSLCKPSLTAELEKEK